MANVYPMPECLAAASTYGDQNRVIRERAINGAPSSAVEIPPRVVVEVSGQVVRQRRDDLVIFVDRLAGGAAFAGLWDFERIRFGWYGAPALNTSNGNEFWHVTGQTNLYNDDAADGTTWRSIFAAANGGASAGATSLAIDGLMPGEIIPRGCMCRIGNYRYFITTTVTANGSGEATLSLATPLRAVVANDASVRVPGDFFVGQLVGIPEISPSDFDGVGDFKMTFQEVYAAEVSGGFTYVVD